MKRISDLGAKLSSKDYKYIVDWDSRSDNSGCQCTDYCRCSKIVSVTFNGIGVQRMLDEVVKTIKDCPDIINKRLNKIDRYCIERILVANKIFEAKNDRFDWYATGGYYGQEMGKISIDDDYAYNIGNCITDMLNLASNRQKIEYVLIKEYGFLLDTLKDANYAIKKIDKSDIFYGNEYRKKISPCDCYSDENYSGIRGVVMLDSGKYRLLDGFHRVASTDESQIDVIVATIK